MAEILMLDGYEYLNVSHSVGKNGVNQPNDVLAVQALLRVIDRSYLGGIKEHQRPYPTGTMTPELLSLINIFQKSFFKREHSRTTGSFIRKARTMFVPGSKRVYTIIALNHAVNSTNFVYQDQFFAKETSSTKDYILSIYPSLKTALSRMNERIDI
jgi:hypothetical protein